MARKNGNGGAGQEAFGPPSSGRSRLKPERVTLEVKLCRKTQRDGTHKIFWVIRWWAFHSWNRMVAETPEVYQAVLRRAAQDQIHMLTYAGPYPNPREAEVREQNVQRKIAAMESGQVDESISIAEL